jgi:transcriptional regulator with XRE-family HTH domain
VTSAEGASLQLARRLRSLRTQAWPGLRITQEQLGGAFGVSVPLISSWERSTNPVQPPSYRLEAYATFFATSRSVDEEPFRLVSSLTDDERVIRDALLAELTGLRDQALGSLPAQGKPAFVDNLWRYPANQDITIVCSELPERRLSQIPGSSPEDPDYTELYKYSDLDSLFELHGHIRAMNPDNNVHLRPGSSTLTPDEFSSHLVLLGGVDWNRTTARVLRRINLPIRQLPRPKDEDKGGFEVISNKKVVKNFEPVVRDAGSQQILEEDVAHFYRSPNPFNQERTVTMCNGTHSAGVLGAVRALTDSRFRDRNNAHARNRFAEQEAFSILSKVQVVDGSVITPDWTLPKTLLHEWP